MTQTKKPDFLLLEDKAERRKAIEQALVDLDERAIAQGEKAISIQDSRGRYGLSCAVIMYSSILASVFLGIASLVYITLPSPYSYVTTLEGKLYEIKPIKVEK